MKRHEPSDKQREIIEPMLPKRTATTGRKPKDTRQMLSDILWLRRTEVPWRDLPGRFGRTRRCTKADLSSNSTWVGSRNAA